MERISAQPTDSEVAQLAQRYAGPLFKLCFSILGNSFDAEDALSETFIRYMTKAPAFQSEEHRRAWLITVARNVCRNLLRSGRRDSLSLDALGELAAREEDRDVLRAVMELPGKYREALYLHYVEGYKVRELAGLLGLSEFAVKKRLQYGREKLRFELDGEV